MAKLTVRYTDNGWPMTEPLGKKEAALLEQHLTPGEEVLGQVIGSFGQAVIATPAKFLVVKSGLMSGQAFGGKATTFDYRNITGIEVRLGLAQGEFEILSAGLSSSQRSSLQAKVNAAELPNAIIFAKVDQKPFNVMAAKLREMGATSSASAAPEASGQPAGDDLIDHLRKLGELRDAGILTEGEFTAKKAQLLGI